MCHKVRDISYGATQQQAIRLSERTHQKGPLTPYFQATLLDCRSVAAQVHWETMTEAVSPVLTMRPAVL